MEKPGLVTMLNMLYIDTRYKVYCEYLNRIIRKTIREKGKFNRDRNYSKESFYYRDNNVLFRLDEYSSGTVQYFISINSDVWREIPDGINPYMIWENGWIDVYHFQDSPDREVLHLNIPGDWENLMTLYE